MRFQRAVDALVARWRAQADGWGGLGVVNHQGGGGGRGKPLKSNNINSQTLKINREEKNNLMKLKMFNVV